MLEALFGNKTVQMVLIFLFVNGKCYGTQLHRVLDVSLTPLQKALLRLERGGIVMSYYEGKTRLYQLNPAFPLIAELEQLLKKAYTLLPPKEKKKYFVVKEESAGVGLTHAEYGRVLLKFWERLSGVSKLVYKAKSQSKEESGWNGTGQGDVVVTKDGGSILIFTEKGKWKSKRGDELDFSNVFRWTFDRDNGVISLEHLRRGVNFPVFLFHLSPIGANSLSCIDSHLCGGDAYFGQLFLDAKTVRLSWRVIGLQKNEEIEYFYS